MHPSYFIPSSLGNRFSIRFWRVSLLFGLPTVLSPSISPLTHFVGAILRIVLNPSGTLLPVHPEMLFTLWWPLISLILLILGFFWDRHLSQRHIHRAPIYPKLLYTGAIAMNWLPFIVWIIRIFAAVFSNEGFSALGIQASGG